MKYFVTDDKNSQEKLELKNKGLYCYDLRSGEDKIISTIEKNVLVNRVGSIITDKEIYFGKAPENYIDYDIFCSENQNAFSIDDLLISKIPLTTIRLDTTVNIESEFDFLFSECENYKELSKLSADEKKDYILDHYADVNDYDLVNINDEVYQLYRIDYSRELEKVEPPKEITIKLIGVDNWDRPVFKDESGNLYKDINLGSGNLALCTALNNDFYGEPDVPVKVETKINIVKS